MILRKERKKMKIEERLYMDGKLDVTTTVDTNEERKVDLPDWYKSALVREYGSVEHGLNIIKFEQQQRKAAAERAQEEWPARSIGDIENELNATKKLLDDAMNSSDFNLVLKLNTKYRSLKKDLEQKRKDLGITEVDVLKDKIAKAEHRFNELVQAGATKFELFEVREDLECLYKRLEEECI